MIDETKERLIVMGGTTEPGVFQVEIIKTPAGGEKWMGSIFLATEQVRQPGYRSLNGECGHAKVFQMTRQAQELFGQGAESSHACLCQCWARRID